MTVRGCHRVAHLRLLVHRSCWRLWISLYIVLGVPGLSVLVSVLVLDRADGDLRSWGAEMWRVRNGHRRLVNLRRSCHRRHRLEVRRHVCVVLARRRGWPSTGIRHSASRSVHRHISRHRHHGRTSASIDSDIWDWNSRHGHGLRWWCRLGRRRLLQSKGSSLVNQTPKVNVMVMVMVKVKRVNLRQEDTAIGVPANRTRMRGADGAAKTGIVEGWLISHRPGSAATVTKQLSLGDSCYSHSALEGGDARLQQWAARWGSPTSA